MAKQVTFSLEALEALVNKAVAAKGLNLQADGKLVPAAAGKAANAAKLELDTVRAFKRKGFGEVTPRVNVKTFNLWVKDGRRPKEGEKSVKVRNFRFFHLSQTRELTSAEVRGFAEKAQVPQVQ
jgi:hypothetical protein